MENVVRRLICAPWQPVGLTWSPASLEHDLSPDVHNWHIETLPNTSDGFSISHRVLRSATHGISLGEVHCILHPFVDWRVRDEDDASIVVSHDRVSNDLDEVRPELWKRHTLIVVVSRETRIICTEEDGHQSDSAFVWSWNGL